MITIDLGSSIVTYAILILLGIHGFSRGFRYMLSIAVFETLGYLLTVQSGNFIVGLVNRFYSNLPKLFAFLLGRDPGGVDALGPLIPDNFQAPLLLRVLVFIGLLVVGMGYAWPWEGKPLRIHGYVVPGSIGRKSESREYRFDMQRNGKVVRAYFTGTPPDAFKDDSEVVLTGRLDKDGFVASHMEAKCPSKYEEKPTGSAGL